MSSKTRILAAFGGLLLGGIAWLATPPDAAANGWNGHNNCCSGHGYWGGWGYPRVAIGFGFGGYPYGYGAAPGFYGAAYPGYGYAPPYPSYGGYPPPPVYISRDQPQPQAAPAQPYVVYFDFDRATLTPHRARVVDHAIAPAHAGGHPQIQVTGFTDAA